MVAVHQLGCFLVVRWEGSLDKTLLCYNGYICAGELASPLALHDTGAMPWSSV